MNKERIKELKENRKALKRATRRWMERLIEINEREDKTGILNELDSLKMDIENIDRELRELKREL